MPFVTEEIWGRLPHRPGDPDLLVIADWPDGAEERALVPDSAAAEAPVQVLIEAIRGIRNARADAGIEPSAWLDAELAITSAPARAAYEDLAAAFRRLARLHVDHVTDRAVDLAFAPGEGTLVVVGRDLEVRLRRAGADLARERARLEKELAEARALLAAADGRLANEAFISRAPAEVVDAARRRAAELRDRVAILAERAERV
jgi:valyl-tRNA synthetase